ncbi:MAG: hypothetical protein U0937_01575 [Thermodesulfovibrionia bacterium]|nr:hypothetical protein [Thermodesulfovibrionia bacterium]
MKKGFYNFLMEIQPMLQVTVGGLLAILGGMIGMWYQARNARRIRMDEIIAERKVKANAEAYRRMKTIESMLIQASPEETLKKILDDEDWFFGERLFLPGKFPDKWLSIRNGLSKALRLQGRTEKADELSKLEDELSKLAEEAILEIYEEMNIPRIKVAH